MRFYLVKLVLRCKVCGKTKVVTLLNDELGRLISEGVPIKPSDEGFLLDSWICSDECSTKFLERKEAERHEG